MHILFSSLDLLDKAGNPRLPPDDFVGCTPQRAMYVKLVSTERQSSKLTITHSLPHLKTVMEEFFWKRWNVSCLLQPQKIPSKTNSVLTVNRYPAGWPLCELVLGIWGWKLINWESITVTSDHTVHWIVCARRCLPRGQLRMNFWSCEWYKPRGKAKLYKK